MKTLAFWLAALEASVVSAVSAFAGSLTLTGHPTGENWVAAGVAAGTAALYTFAKQIGANQAAPPAAPPTA